MKNKFKIGDTVAFQVCGTGKQGRIIGVKKCIFGIKYVVEVAFVGIYIVYQSCLIKIH